MNNQIADARDRQLAAARAKQEAIKQRKKDEDDRSEMRARMHHAMATAPYYAEAYARDHWNATEGYRILASVKASDIARRPQRKATSGADLAAGIKPKKGGGITFVSDDMLKTNKAFSATGGAIDMAGNGVIDEQQVKSWMDSFEKPGLLTGKKMSGSKKAVGGTPVVLVSHDELALEEMSIFTLPQYGLVGMLDDSLMVLKDAGLGAVGWTNRDHYSYVVPCGSRLIGRKDRSLYVVHDQASEKLLELNTNEFSIFPHDDQSVFVLSWHEGLSTILKVDVAKRAYSEMDRLPYGVWTIASNGKEVFTLVDNAVFLFGLSRSLPVVR